MSEDSTEFEPGCNVTHQGRAAEFIRLDDDGSTAVIRPYTTGQDTRVPAGELQHLPANTGEREPQPPGGIEEDQE